MAELGELGELGEWEDARTGGREVGRLGGWDGIVKVQ